MERLTWEQHLRRLRWSPGEHAALVGSTGRGKTTLAYHLLQLRTWVVVLAVKPEDPMYEWPGYRLARPGAWPPDIDLSHRWIVYGAPRKRHKRRTPTRDAALMCADHRAVLTDAWRAGAWTVYLDEARLDIDVCNLKTTVAHMMSAARGLGVTMIAGAQRPRHIPVEVWSESTHLYLRSVRDKNDLKRLDEVSGIMDPHAIRTAMHQLPIDGWWWLYVHRDGDLWAVEAPPPPTPTRRGLLSRL